MGETFEYFKEQTSLQIFNQLKIYQNQAWVILSEITAKEKLYEIQQQQQINLFNSMEKFTNESSLIRQNLLLVRAEMGITDAYIKGYRLLNEIGHFFNGEWQYSITLFGQENVTFQMDIDDFLQAGEAHLSGFRLSSKTTILEKMKTAQVTKINWNDKQGRYNLDFYNNYKSVIGYARGILIKGGENPPNYNLGQQLEGYMAFGEVMARLKKLSSISRIVDSAKVEKLGAARFNELHQGALDIFIQLQKQTNSRGFWSGGDTKGEGQVKGEGASIFQYSTIINQLEKFIQITGRFNFSKLEQALQNNVKIKARSHLEKKMKIVINEIMSQFNAISTNKAVLDDITELSGEIDNLLTALI